LKVIVQDNVLRGLKKFAARDRLVRTLRALQSIAFFTLSGLVAVFLADRILFEIEFTRSSFSTPEIVATTGILFLGGLVVSGVLLSFFLGRDLKTAAIEYDRRGGGNQSVATAFELMSNRTGGIFFESVVRQAAAVIDRVPAERLMPIPLTRHLALLAFALLGGSVLLAFPGAALYPPRAVFSVEPDRGTAPLTVTARHACCGHISEFRWNWGDGQTSDAPEAQHTYRDPGRYVITLEAVGPRGSDRIQRTVTVLSPRQPFASFKAIPAKGRAPLEVRFHNTSQNAQRYEWSFGDGASSSEENPVHVFDKPGTYAVRLRAFSGTMVDEAAAPVRVLHPDGPVADFVAVPTQGEAPLKVQFETRSLGNITDYEWDVGDFYSGDEAKKTDKNPTHEYRIPGVYTVRLKVKGPHGEDEEIKERYIRVGKQNGGGGGGGGSNPNNSPAPRPRNPNPSKPGQGEGRLFGDKQNVKPRELDPTKVDPIIKGDKNVEKDLPVITPENPGSGGKTQEKKYKDVFPFYERQAEETIQREQIPADSRKFVKEYFDRIRPKE
jgi:PKD repeat protein